jgi:serine/threonine protein phosphatase PrpC
MSQSIPDNPTAVWTVTAEICGGTEVGPTRQQNQDAIMVATVVGAATGTRLAWAGNVRDAGVPVAVIDGMGGYAGGADAAALAATALAGADPNQAPSDWDGWFEALSQRIARAGQAWGTPDMGATAAVLMITPTGLVMTNVGDCRIYRVSGGHLGQISVDDRTDNPDSSTVTQALGGSVRIDAHTWRQAYKGGAERYVLCSDGVWTTLDPAVVRDLCTAERPPAQVVEAIAASIYAQHAADNCSVIVVDLIATATDNQTAVPQPIRGTWPISIQTTPTEQRSHR